MQEKILDISVVAITWGVDNSRDVEYASQIAQKFGGGGHAGAAGFHFLRSDEPFHPSASVSYDLNLDDN